RPLSCHPARSLFPLSLSLFSFSWYGSPLCLPSFPTRRSSDLAGLIFFFFSSRICLFCAKIEGKRFRAGTLVTEDDVCLKRIDRRSEEHTSELQSRFDLVCRLLLEKKKTQCITTR